MAFVAKIELKSGLLLLLDIHTYDMARSTEYFGNVLVIRVNTLTLLIIIKQHVFAIRFVVL